MIRREGRVCRWCDYPLAQDADTALYRMRRLTLQKHLADKLNDELPPAEVA